MGFVDLLLKVIKKPDDHVVSECIMPSSNLEDMKVHIMRDFYSVEERVHSCPGNRRYIIR